MKQTENGKVTPEMLDELESWSTRHKKAYSVGIGNYTLLALVNEVREHRSEVKHDDNTG